MHRVVGTNRFPTTNCEKINGVIAGIPCCCDWYGWKSRKSGQDFAWPLILIVAIVPVGRLEWVTPITAPPTVHPAPSKPEPQPAAVLVVLEARREPSATAIVTLQEVLVGIPGSPEILWGQWGCAARVTPSPPAPVSAASLGLGLEWLKAGQSQETQGYDVLGEIHDQTEEITSSKCPALYNYTSTTSTHLRRRNNLFEFRLQLYLILPTSGWIDSLSRRGGSISFSFAEILYFLVCTTHFFARIRLRSNGGLDQFCPWYKNRGVEQKKHSFYLWWKRSFKPSLLCLVSFCTATLLISPFCTTDSYKFSCVLLPIQNNILKKLFFKTLVHSTLLLIWEDFFWASIGSF